MLKISNNFFTMQTDAMVTFPCFLLPEQSQLCYKMLHCNPKMQNITDSREEVDLANNQAHPRRCMHLSQCKPSQIL